MTRPAPHLTRPGGATRLVSICETELPLAPVLAGDRVALALITGVEGPSYRPVGAAMAISAEGEHWGSLSSGCIERDVVIHARAALQDGAARTLRYGAGSPFRDLVLPCGGGLDIAILPAPDRAKLAEARAALQARRPALLELGPLVLDIQPQLRVLAFGKGPELRLFSALAAAAGYPVESFSPDAETLAGLEGAQILSGKEWPAGLKADARTAVTLFFHDHDWEPALLQAALESPALYVGAQGSLRAHRARCAELAARGVPAEAAVRLAAPFGLIPSVRDPRTLAASVLAQVLEAARLA
ncbi:XdhC family protein [Paracoccus xiamenensis]|uniref:XdhC family protein n=1 Tax=Paracoccus xiamenensis TaxID=2714901 RepID=UPI0014084FD7|nr:XdhC family protein [Paracoccus xiamenensis]NHF73251.1 XdhC family protein [Paracoccus xiamenensis]